jgi:hypothetical protein
MRQPFESLWLDVFGAALQSKAYGAFSIVVSNEDGKRLRSEPQTLQANYRENEHQHDADYRHVEKNLFACRLATRRNRRTTLFLVYRLLWPPPNPENPIMAAIAGSMPSLLSSSAASSGFSGGPF